MRRRLDAFVAVLAAALIAGNAAAAQEWAPTDPIELVVHTGPGAGGDLFARGIVSILEKESLVPVRVQVSNRPGGGTTTAAAYMKERAGNQHTLAVFTNGWMTATLMQEEATVSPLDLTPVANLVEDSTIIVTAASSPYQSLQELIDLGRSQPGTVKVASGSVGSVSHLVLMQMEKLGISWAFVPFPSGGERVAAVMGGHVQLMMMEPAEAVAMVRGGQLRVLGKVDNAPLAEFPDVRSLNELGVQIDNIATFRGIVAPPDVSPEAVKYYETMFARMVETPSWDEYVKGALTTTRFLDAAGTTKFVEEFRDRIRPILELAGVKIIR